MFPLDSLESHTLVNESWKDLYIVSVYIYPHYVHFSGPPGLEVWEIDTVQKLCRTRKALLVVHQNIQQFLLPGTEIMVVSNGCRNSV